MAVQYYSAAQRSEDNGMNTTSHIQTYDAVSKPESRIDWGKIGSYAFLVLFAIIYLGPLLMLVNTSLKTTPSFMKDPIAFASEFQLQNFVEAWNKANFPKYLLNSVLYTVGGTVIFILTAVFVAFPIARGYVKYSGWLLTMFVVALFLPPALIPQFQLMRALGLYNTPIRLHHAVHCQPDWDRHPGELYQNGAQGTG